jgi:PAS domain S-box-containing protein
LEKINESIEDQHQIDYKFLIENTSDIISLTDKEVNIQFLSPSFEAITGYEISKFIGRNALDLVHPEDTSIVSNVLEKALRNPGTPCKCTHRIFLKNEGWNYFESIGKYVNDESKDLLIISSRNINEEVELEKELKRKDQIYETILRNFPHGTVTLYDREFRYIFCDGLELKKVGMTSENIIGKTIYDILPEDKADHLRKFLEPSLKDGKEYEYDIENQGRYYKLITLPIINEKGIISECLAMTQNITEMKKAEEMLEKSEKKLKIAQRIANIGIWEWDLSGNKFYWSDELYKLFGKSRSFQPSFERYLRNIYPDDRASIKSVIERSIKEKSHFRIDCRIRVTGSDIKYQHIEGEVITDESEQSEKVIGVCYDITEKKKFEEYLIETNRMLKEVQAELIHSEKLAAVGRIASNMAHEIRNPLANIKASSQILKGKIKGRSGLKNYLNVIIRNIDNADRIIKDLLDYSSPANIKLKAGNILNILKEVKKLIEPRCREKHIKCIIKSKIKRIPSVLLNEKKLLQAFLNFLSNSVDAVKERGIISVTLDSDKNKGNLIVTIKDSGTGIPEENLTKILEPFFTTKSDGTGLGLSIAHQVLKLHNASLKISSDEGKGTEIRITFPVLKK